MAPLAQLEQLVREAVQAVLPASHGQRASDHVWDIVEGGRACPRGGNGSQSVYVCSLCGVMDYGEPPGPGFHDCFDAPSGCDGCFSLDAAMDFPSAGAWVPLDHYRLSTTCPG